MPDDTLHEARRQIGICNACRYCEGYCSVFPSINLKRNISDADILNLANLCHNCRGCYYACQYIEPHEFALNLPGILAQLRQKSWRDHAWPAAFAAIFRTGAMAAGGALIAGFALFIWQARMLRPETGEGFYAVISHAMLLALFLPAFAFALFSVAVSLRRYWKSIGGGWISPGDVLFALRMAASMRDLSGGHGAGCNYEDKDRYSNARRWFHQAAMYGFGLCFAATCAGTVLHYGFDLKAPYALTSLPKLLGISGGVLLCAGTFGLGWLKLKADRNLGAAALWGGEMAFIVLLFTVSLSGLALVVFAANGLIGFLLPLHLGAVLAFFLLVPYSKMIHGFYRFAALLHDAARSRSA